MKQAKEIDEKYFGALSSEIDQAATENALLASDDADDERSSVASTIPRDNIDTEHSVPFSDISAPNQLPPPVSSFPEWQRDASLPDPHVFQPTPQVFESIHLIIVEDSFALFLGTDC